MEPNQNNNQDIPPKGTTPIDLDAILLPEKKGVPSADSADRASAGAVLADQATPYQPSAPVLPRDSHPPVAAEGVKQLETFQGDIEEVVEKNKVSVVSIAAAEATRRSREPLEKKTDSIVKKILFIILGILVLSAAVGIILYALTQQHSVAVPAQPVSPSITVDETTIVSLATTTSATSALSLLANTNSQLSVPLGLVERLLITTDANGQQAMDAQTFLSLIAPSAPQNLVRTLQAPFVLGIYSYHQNEPFLIFTVDSYTQAYAGMLAWEPTLAPALSPLFALATSTSASVATTTAQVIQSPFVDGVLENHDVREIVDSTHTPVLLWTFLDAQTLVIATSDETLQEIISRLTETPITQGQ